jgi:hypothetical protein
VGPCTGSAAEPPSTPRERTRVGWARMPEAIPRSAGVGSRQGSAMHHRRRGSPAGLVATMWRARSARDRERSMISGRAGSNYCRAQTVPDRRRVACKSAASGALFHSRGSGCLAETVGHARGRVGRDVSLLRKWGVWVGGFVSGRVGLLPAGRRDSNRVGWVRARRCKRRPGVWVGLRVPVRGP